MEQDYIVDPNGDRDDHYRELAATVIERAFNDYKTVYRKALPAKLKLEQAEGYFYSEEFEFWMNAAGLDIDVEQRMAKIHKEVEACVDKDKIKKKFSEKYDF